jgi:HTH-type transcriptional regulator/antitoxin HipB
MANFYPLRFSNQLRQHLRALRKRRGLTQAELGKLIGVSQARIAEIEASPGTVSFEQMMQLLLILGVTLVLQDDDQGSYPQNEGKKNTRKTIKRAPLDFSKFKQFSGKMHVGAKPKLGITTPSGEWSSYFLRKGGPYSRVTGVLVSPPINYKSTSGNKPSEATSLQRQKLQALNPDKDVIATSRRNFVIRPKKGSW